jgi:hypothetical protein
MPGGYRLLVEPEEDEIGGRYCGDKDHDEVQEPSSVATAATGDHGVRG